MRTIGTARHGMLLVIIASTLWGTVGVTSKVLSSLTATNPLSISFLRLAVAAPVLLIAGWRLLGREMWTASRRDVGLMMLIGILIAADHALYFAAISFTGVTIATLVAICCAPVLVTVFTAFSERKAPTRFTLTILSAALLGTVLLVIGNGTGGQLAASLTGVAFALGSACGYAGMILFGKFLTEKRHSLQITAIGFSAGAVCLLIVSQVNGFSGSFPPTGWLLVLYMGVVPTAIAYGLFLVGVRSTPAPVASVLVLLEPLTAAVLSGVLFGERLSVAGIIGVVLLLGAIYALSRETG